MSRTYESPSRKAKAEETRRRILRALVDLLVEERPSMISIPLVAKRAEVSVRIVYHYFPTKDALFDGLLAAIPDMLERPDGPVPDAASTPAELAAAMPAVYRYLDANRPLFHALAISELGERVAQHRRPERLGRTDAVLEPLRARLEDAELRKLRAVVGLLASFDGFDSLTRTWGLSVDEAADVAAWGLRVLCDRARRSGVGT